MLIPLNDADQLRLKELVLQEAARQHADGRLAHECGEETMPYARTIAHLLVLAVKLGATPHEATRCL